MAGPYRPTGRLGCPADGRTPKACHTRATAEHHQGALAVTHAQTRWSLTCKDAGFNRPDSVLLSSRSQVRILLGAQFKPIFSVLDRAARLHGAVNRCASE